MPTDECFERIHLLLGELKSDVKGLDGLQEKMDRCILVCETGNARITLLETRAREVEQRMLLLEKAENLAPRLKSMEDKLAVLGMPAHDKNLAVLGFGGISAAVGAALLDLAQHWETVKALLK